MGNDKLFRKALFGYNKHDVNDYITELDKKHIIDKGEILAKYHEASAGLETTTQQCLDLQSAVEAKDFALETQKKEFMELSAEYEKYKSDSGNIIRDAEDAISYAQMQSGLNDENEILNRKLAESEKKVLEQEQQITELIEKVCMLEAEKQYYSALREKLAAAEVQVLQKDEQIKIFRQSMDKYKTNYKK